jgi:hypothetical protein
MRAPSQPKDRDRIDGHYLWEIEIAFYRKCGMGDEEAQFRTIMRWADAGNLRPLRAAIAKARVIDDKTNAIDEVTLVCLKELIDQGCLVAKPRLPHRPKSPDLLARAVVGALRYEDRPDKRFHSDAVFKEIADELSMTEDALRKAVRTLRKVRRRKPA